MGKKGIEQDVIDEEILVYKVNFNRDGSITITCLINVYGEKGEMWHTTDRKIRLKKTK
jgi:hypothetical protein